MKASKRSSPQLPHPLRCYECHRKRDLPMKVLVVEDSPILGRALLRGLGAEGFAVDVAPSAEEALVFVLSYEYDAIVLDWMLPGISGLEFLQRLRDGRGSATPVLMLTARAEVADRVQGLDHGADDYLPKPFEFVELVARIRSLCRRGTRPRSPRLEAGRLAVDTAARRACVAEQELDLTPSEYAILEALLRHRGAVLSKEWLVERLHTADGTANPNVVEVFMSSLRKKLRSAGQDDLIVTRRGHGYLVPEGDEGPAADAD